MRLSQRSQRSARASNASTSLLSMATTYVGKSAPIRGPYLKHAFAKYVLKGEDAWLQQRDVDTSISSSKGVPWLSSPVTSIAGIDSPLFCDNMICSVSLPAFTGTRMYKPSWA